MKLENSINKKLANSYGTMTITVTPTTCAASSQRSPRKIGPASTSSGRRPVDPNGDLWLLDLWRAQASSDLWVEIMLDLAKKWMPVAWAEESGQIKSAMGPLIERRMHDRRIPLFRRQFPSRHDKSIRAQAIRGRMAMDGLWVPTRAPWYAAFQQELLGFPAAKHDDMVDALGLIGQMLATLLSGRKPKKDAGLGFNPETDAYRPIEDDSISASRHCDCEFCGCNGCVVQFLIRAARTHAQGVTPEKRDYRKLRNVR